MPRRARVSGLAHADGARAQEHLRIPIAVLLSAPGGLFTRRRRLHLAAAGRLQTWEQGSRGISGSVTCSACSARAMRRGSTRPPRRCSMEDCPSEDSTCAGEHAALEGAPCRRQGPLACLPARWRSSNPAADQAAVSHSMRVDPSPRACFTDAEARLGCAPADRNTQETEGRRGACLVRGLDADVGALRQRGGREVGVEGEVRAVRLVHDERHAVLVRAARERRHVAAHAVVRGADLRGAAAGAVNSPDLACMH